ncbi:hypothetical protein ACSBR2_025972 [Camellia fascicularis]
MGIRSLLVIKARHPRGLKRSYFLLLGLIYFAGGSGKRADPNIEEKNHNEGARDQNPREKDVDKEGDAPKKVGRDEYYNESDLQLWNDRCLRRDSEMKGMANKLADLQSVVNFMM